MALDRVAIFDTTLRDGEQSPGCSMNAQEKLRMALQLSQLGVDVIEAGFPVASEDDFKAVRSIAEACSGPTIAALSRATPQDIRRAWGALKPATKPRIHTFLATSDIHLKHKLGKSRSEALLMAREAVRLASSLCPEVEFSAEDATRSDWDFLAEIVEAVIDEGAGIVNIPDTVGYTLPDEYAALITHLKMRVRNIDRAVISVHCHNDLGLAVANSLAAVKAGARQVECTVNGIGERAGNASLEELVMAMRVRRDLMPFETNVRSEEIHRSSQLLTRITGVPVQPNKAIVGRNAFAHESGIHQHGVIKHRMTYEIMTPESVGVSTSSLVLGKHSGRTALKKRLDDLGWTLKAEELESVYERFVRLCDQKKEVFDEDLLALVQTDILEPPAIYILHHAQVTAGTSLQSTALVTLEREGQILTETAAGDGPVDAVCLAIDKITGVLGVLQEFTVRGVTGGADALGEVVLKVTFGDQLTTGRAASTDIVEASARAYLGTVNKLLSARLVAAIPADIAHSA
jgi:2-isopropylmalate synthase